MFLSAQTCRFWGFAFPCPALWDSPLAKEWEKRQKWVCKRNHGRVSAENCRTRRNTTVVCDDPLLPSYLKDWVSGHHNLLSALLESLKEKEKGTRVSESELDEILRKLEQGEGELPPPS